MRSKLSFVKAISTCFSQCYVSTLFIFVDRRREEEEQKQKKKKKDCRPSVESSSLSPPASAALLFPFPFPFSFAVFCIFHCSAAWTVESDRPLTFPSSLNPSPPRCSSPSPSFGLLSTVLQTEQWRVTGLRRFHRPSVHHCRVALPLLLRLGCSPLFCNVKSGEWITLPLLLLLRLGCSPLFCNVNCRECLHCSWPDRSDPNLNALDWSDPVK